MTGCGVDRGRCLAAIGSGREVGCRRVDRRGGRPFGPHIDLLAHVGRIVGRLGADRFPASKLSRLCLIDSLLVGKRQVEELAHHLEHIGSQLGVDAVVGDQSESHVVADVGELGTELCAGAVGPTQFAHINDWNLMKRHALTLVNVLRANA